MKNFSVLMSVYKKENPVWLSVCLDSVLNSSRNTPKQIVLVEDGPLTDDLYDVITCFKTNNPSLLTVVPLQKNRGLGGALNEGLKHCCFDLVARMDCDDIVYPGRFDVQLKFMNEHPDVDILGGFALNINAEGESKDTRRVPTVHNEILSLLWTCPLIHPTVIFRKAMILSAGSYSKTLKRRQDYDLWFRCAEKGAKFANLSVPLIQYRVTDNTYVRNDFNVAFAQMLIGLRGTIKLRLGIKAYIGVCYPLVIVLFPIKIRKIIERLSKKIDPRKRF